MSEENKGITADAAPENEAPVTEQELGEPESQSDFLVPEKFIGKGAEDVIRAYVELEKYQGKIASERAQEKKEKEELAKRLEQLESELKTRPFNAQVPSQPAATQELDPLAVLDSQFENDPKEAIRQALRLQEQQLSKRQKEEVLRQRFQEATNYYYKAKQENPDFARREATMQRLLAEYGSIIHPDMAGSVMALKALDLMSRGMDVGYYEQQAVERAKKEGLSRREEKINSQVEDAVPSQGTVPRNFKDLSLAEMEKILGFAKPE